MSRRAYGPRGRHTAPRWTLARDIAASIRRREARGEAWRIEDYTTNPATQHAVTVWLQLPDSPALAKALICQDRS